MSFRKKMFIWDLKELDSFAQQSLATEPFNMWPSGNCGHVYSASQTQARRHISGWAMRNTNNHNINILKKSCLGVLVCSKRCRRDDSSVVAVRPAICDKARRKQIGRKCPNACDGVLVMQQCKGHSGYPVTHFWRHHEDKVFFLGKGHHDHPKPELKLSTEKRKTYIRVPSRRTMGSVSSLMKTQLTDSGYRKRSALTTTHPGLSAYPASTNASYAYQSSFYHTSPSSYSYTMQALQNKPDADFYIPPISQELSFNQKQTLCYPSSVVPTQSETSAFFSYPLPTAASASCPTSVASLPAGYTYEQSLDTHQEKATILDLSLPSATALDATWQCDQLVSPASRSFYSSNQYDSYPTAAHSVQPDHSCLQNLDRMSEIHEKTYETLMNEKKNDEPFRLHALWDSIYPDGHASTSQYIATPVPVSTTANAAAELSKTEPDFDDLDMGDISNILALPATTMKCEYGAVKSKDDRMSQHFHDFQSSKSTFVNLSDSFASKPTALTQKTESQPAGTSILPTLSTFLHDIDYI